MTHPMLTETIALLDRLIAFPTISRDPNLALIDFLAERLEAAGARVEVLRDETAPKANLWATFGPEADGGIVLSGHTDVVPVADQPWTSDPFEMAMRDGRLFGRGTCDMKGFIAACVAMAPELGLAAKDRPLHFAFTHDEETGCVGAMSLARTLRTKGLTPGLAIIGEPTEMRIIEGHKGCYEYSTHFHGLEGHGSAPDLGVNAVEYAARYVARILELKDALRARAPVTSRFVPPWSTINVGVVEGGQAHNVIAPRARVDWDLRPVRVADADFVKADLARLIAEDLLPAMRAVHPEAMILTEVVGETPGLEPMEANAARDLVAALTGANGTDLVAFGTEAGIFQDLGMDVVVCGPGSIEQAHKADEYVEIAELDRCLDMLSALRARL